MPNRRNEIPEENKIKILIQYEQNKKKIILDMLPNDLNEIIGLIAQKIDQSPNDIDIKYFDKDFEEYINLENIQDIKSEKKIRVLISKKD